MCAGGSARDGPNGERCGGARYTHGRAWRVAVTVHGFASRSQCLGFEWAVKHAPVRLRTDRAPPGVTGRRCVRLAAVLRQDAGWWQRHPPRPTRLEVRVTQPGLASLFEALLADVAPWCSVVTAEEDDPAAPPRCDADAEAPDRTARIPE